MTEIDRRHAGWLKASLDPAARRDTVKWLIDNIPPFDTIVCTGMSGVALSSIVANHFGGDLTIVRKADDNSHSWRKVEGAYSGRAVMLDDFIDTGSTLTNVREALSRDAPALEWCGLILYRDQGIPQKYGLIQGVLGSSISDGMTVVTYYNDMYEPATRKITL